MPPTKKSTINLDFQNFLRKLIIAGIFFILFLPIIGDYGDYLYPVGRELIFRAVIEILFVAYIFLLFLERRFLLKLSPILLAVFGFWIISALSTIFSLQSKLSFWGDFYRGLGFFTLTHYLMFFILLVAVVKTWKEWLRFIYFSVFVSIPVVIIAFILHFIQPGRALSTLNNPVFLGAYLLLIFFITIALSWHIKNKGIRILLFFLALLQIQVLLWTLSRGALVGFMAGMASFIILTPIRKWKGSALLLILLVILFLNGIYLGAHVFRNEVLYFFLRDMPVSNRILAWPTTIFEGRLQGWETGIQAIKEKPLLGFGGDNFNIPFDKYYQPEAGELDLFGAWYDRAHNWVLDIGVTTGLVGLAAYLSIWITALWSLFKLLRDFAYGSAWFRDKPKATQNNAEQHAEQRGIYLLSLALLATFVAYLTQNLFNLDTVTSQIYVFFWLALLTFLAKTPTNYESKRITNQDKDGRPTQSSNAFLWIAGIILIPLLLFSLKNYNFDFWKGAIAHNKTEKLVMQGQYDKAMEIYERAINDDWSHVHHTLRHKYASALITYANQIRGNQPGKSKELANKALVLLDRNVESERYYFNRGWLLSGVIASSLIEFGDASARDKADYYFSKALEMSPGRPGGWIEWAKTDITLKNFESAKEKLKKAAGLSPNLVEPYFYRGIAAIYEKNYREAQKFFEFSQETFKNNGSAGYDPEGDSAMQEIGKAYFGVRDFGNLTQLYTGILQKNPKNLQLWISLAVTYKEMGENEKARETLAEAEKLFPGLSQNPMIREFLKNL